MTAKPGGCFGLSCRLTAGGTVPVGFGQVICPLFFLPVLLGFMGYYTVSGLFRYSFCIYFFVLYGVRTLLRRNDLKKFTSCQKRCI